LYRSCDMTSSRMNKREK